MYIWRNCCRCQSCGFARFQTHNSQSVCVHNAALATLRRLVWVWYETLKIGKILLNVCNTVWRFLLFAWGKHWGKKGEHYYYTVPESIAGTALDQNVILFVSLDSLDTQIWFIEMNSFFFFHVVVRWKTIARAPSTIKSMSSYQS